MNESGSRRRRPSVAACGPITWARLEIQAEIQPTEAARCRARLPRMAAGAPRAAALRVARLAQRAGDASPPKALDCKTVKFRECETGVAKFQNFHIPQSIKV